LGLIAELRRRNLFRVAGLYLAGAWLVTQVAGTVLPMFEAPPWIARAIVVVLAIGFLPALAFAWMYELSPNTSDAAAGEPPAASSARQTRRRLDIAIIGVLLVTVVVLLADRFVVHRDGATTTDERSIAVLPLTNEGQADQQYFSDGLSEDLITALSQLSGLKVIARSSSFQFRDSKDDVRTIGAKLGVATLLEGSVRHANDVVRVSAQLINVADSRTLWSQRYDRPYKDLFALQDELAQAVAGALQFELAPDAATAQDDRPPSGSIDAKNAFLEGMYHADHGTESELREAIRSFETAVRIDPGYAFAYATLGVSWTSLGARFLEGEQQRAAFEEARKAVDTALRIAPNLATAHGASANLLVNAYLDWRGAEPEIRRALELSPASSRAQFIAALNLAALGQVERAVALTRKSLTTNPLSSNEFHFLSKMLRALGRLDEAETALRRALELQPDAARIRSDFVALDVQRGDAAAARAMAETIAPGNWHDQALALAMQIGTDRETADAALRRFLDESASGMEFQIAQIHAVRGDADRAFEWLERAWTARDPGLQYVLYDPFLLTLRDDPRFAAFCAKAGLPATTDAKPMRVAASGG